MEVFLFTLSALLGITAYVLYFRDTHKSIIGPNRWSWLIWGVTTVVEVLTYFAVSGDILTSSVFIVSALSCIVITILVWKRMPWQKPSGTEILTVLASIAALVIWLVFHEAWWAHVVMLIAIPVAFIPTFKAAWENWREEDSPAWIFWTISDFIAFLYVLHRFKSYEELPYAIIETLCHATMWIIVLWRGSGNKRRIKQTTRLVFKVIQVLTITTLGAGTTAWLVSSSMKMNGDIVLLPVTGIILTLSITIAMLRLSFGKKV